MTVSFIDLAAEGVKGLRPYQPGKPITELEREYGIKNAVKLASNENPMGASPLAIEAAGNALKEVEFYPDGGGFELRAALSRWHDIDPVQITLGNGSNDVLDLIGRVFLTPDRESIYSAHAFVVYHLTTLACGATGRVAAAHDGSRGPAFGHDLEAMRALINDKTAVIYIANPNNPTGTWLKRDELEAFISAVPPRVVVVIDEAYIEYVDEPEFPDSAQWLKKYPNLVVCRTFSKAYGLAGLRVGYALSGPEVADLLNRVRQPFNVNAPAMAAACAALGDQEHIKRAVDENRRGMAVLAAAFAELGLNHIPSVGNFVSVDFGRPAGPIYEGLLREGVIVRPVANYGMPNHLRITVGSGEQNVRVVNALRKVLAGQTE
ncbi:MAG: histidinol-phosphate transaminase [Proteobacteria bacterium]|nr:MAG: histidinol-phosphate transaminase [Pseudomonadota bacterium]